MVRSSHCISHTPNSNTVWITISDSNKENRLQFGHVRVYYIKMNSENKLMLILNGTFSRVHRVLSGQNSRTFKYISRTKLQNPRILLLNILMCKLNVLLIVLLLL